MGSLKSSDMQGIPSKKEEKGKKAQGKPMEMFWPTTKIEKKRKSGTQGNGKLNIKEGGNGNPKRYAAKRENRFAEFGKNEVLHSRTKKPLISHIGLGKGRRWNSGLQLSKRSEEGDGAGPAHRYSQPQEQNQTL